MERVKITAQKRGWGTYFAYGMLILFLGYIVQKEVELPSVVLLSLVIFGGMILLFKASSSPATAVYALAAYLPFSRILPGDFGGALVSLNFTNILTIVALFAWMVSISISRREFYRGTPLDLLIIIFLILGCISVFRAEMHFGALYFDQLLIALKRWMTPVLFFFICGGIIRSREEIKQTVIIVMIVMAVVASMAIKDYIDYGAAASSMESARIGGICEQSNMLAAFFVYYMFLFAGFLLVYWRKNIRYWALFIPFLACFRGIQVTFSRGGYVAFAAGALAIAFFKSKMLFVAATIGLAFLIMHPAFLPKGMTQRMSSTFRDDVVFASNVEDVVDKSALVRMEIWKGGMEMIKQYPMLGVGYGLFPIFLPLYAPTAGSMDAHNEYILIAAEMGLPTLFIFLLIILIVFFATRKLYRISTDPFIKAFALGFLGGLGGLVISNIFGGRLDSQEVSSYFWILSALVFRALDIERETAKAKIDKKRAKK